jgi:hypothetical protein
MQRAAAAAAAAPSSPSPSSPATQSPLVDEPERPIPKRPRLFGGKTAFNRAGIRSASDLQAISAAVAAEEQKRADAISRLTAEVGETEWVLKFVPSSQETSQSMPNAMSGSGFGGTQYPPQLHIVPAGSLDTEDEDMACAGRRSYGNYKPKRRSEVRVPRCHPNNLPLLRYSPLAPIYIHFIHSR